MAVKGFVLVHAVLCGGRILMKTISRLPRIETHTTSYQIWSSTDGIEAGNPISKRILRRECVTYRIGAMYGDG